ncbi:MAG: aldehyde dehydrogenase family protein [Planctomycetota bacterium]|nr:aldehyde dehydrogenase family protein [Planctomycetota bacterium]
MTQLKPWPCYIAGKPVVTDDLLDVTYPFDGSVTAQVSLVGPEHLDQAIETMLHAGTPLTRHERSQVLETARQLLLARADEFADLIRSETGLCMRETRYEVGRSQDVLQFAAMEALKDDGQVFSCDITPHGKARKIFTIREPLRSAAAITPFNHPLNQVAHKLAPAIACGTPIILKPSEKTPLSAIRMVELLYEAGLPGWMLSVLVGPLDTVVTPLIRDERIELVSFTGSVAIGKQISTTAGYKKLCLELGGNSPLIVLEDADLDHAVTLAAEGCYRNSGQRCTAVKRLLVHKDIIEDFTQRLVEKTAEYRVGDPSDPETLVGTVIDTAAADELTRRVRDAVAAGARVLTGGENDGACMPPTVIADVPRSAEMVQTESFGPLAPILAIEDLDDAIELANSTAYGLSTGIVTNDLNRAIEAVRRIRTGTVNINDVPGYRIECSPFGGVKDSGLGIKEGVIEAMKYMTTVKTFSLPW